MWRPAGEGRATESWPLQCPNGQDAGTLFPCKWRAHILTAMLFCREGRDKGAQRICCRLVSVRVTLCQAALGPENVSFEGPNQFVTESHICHHQQVVVSASLSAVRYPWQLCIPAGGGAQVCGYGAFWLVPCSARHYSEGAQSPSSMQGRH